MTLPDIDLHAFVAATVAEDLGAGGDVTSDAVVPAQTRLTAVLAARDASTVAGLSLAALFFTHLDPAATVVPLAEDGQSVPAGTPLMRIEGNARALLAAERSALNTLQHLSGIATLTRQYADAIAGTGATLLDTRKTIPGLRALEKYAARMGGATNHRMRLDDGVLIKDNHVALAGGVAEAVRRAKAAETGLPVWVEVDRVEQIPPALAAGADGLLLDNMSLDELREGVALVPQGFRTEASGGVTLAVIRAIAETGVTHISVGRLTQSAPAADIGMDYA